MEEQQKHSSLRAWQDSAVFSWCPIFKALASSKPSKKTGHIIRWGPPSSAAESVPLVSAAPSSWCYWMAQAERAQLGASLHKEPSALSAPRALSLLCYMQVKQKTSSWCQKSLISSFCHHGTPPLPSPQSTDSTCLLFNTVDSSGA